MLSKRPKLPKGKLHTTVLLTVKSFDHSSGEKENFCSNTCTHNDFILLNCRISEQKIRMEIKKKKTLVQQQLSGSYAKSGSMLPDPGYEIFLNDINEVRSIYSQDKRCYQKITRPLQFESLFLFSSTASCVLENVSIYFQYKFFNFKEHSKGGWWFFCAVKESYWCISDDQ